MVLLEPTVTSFVPSGVYAQRVVPLVWAGRGRGREAMKVAAMLSIGASECGFEHPGQCCKSRAQLCVFGSWVIS
jgi:hypothetical protein